MEAMTFGLIIVVVSLVVAVLIATNGNDENHIHRECHQDGHKDGWFIVPCEFVDYVNLPPNRYMALNENHILVGKDGLYIAKERFGLYVAIETDEDSQSYALHFTKEGAKEAIENYILQENNKADDEKREKEFLQQPPNEYTPYSTTKPLDRQ